MRKLVCTDTENQLRKLMVFESKHGVYLLAYDCLQDTCCTWDLWFDTLESASIKKIIRT